MNLKKAFVLFILLFSSSCYAQNNMATVDTRILLMLHPAMVDFDYAMERFYRDSSEEKKAEKVYADLYKAQQKTDVKRKELKSKSDSLAQAKFELETAIDKLKNPLGSDEIERLKANKKNLSNVLLQLQSVVSTSKEQQKLNSDKIKDINLRIKDIDGLINNEVVVDEKYKKSRLEELNNQLIQVEKQIKQNQEEQLIVEDEAISSVYLTRKETKERIEKIKNEILNIIKDAAKDAKYSIVIDNSFAMRSVNRKRRRGSISVTEDAPDLVSTNLFHVFLNLEITDELLSFTNLPGEYAKKHIIAGHTIGMQSNLKQYLEFRNYMPDKLSSFSNGNIFLIGGNDITVYVASKLIDRYSIPDSTKKMLLKTLKDYMSFEIEPDIHKVEY